MEFNMESNIESNIESNMESNTIQDVLANIRVKLKYVRKLLDDHEKFSTQSEPHKIKYQAIEYLKTMETDLVNVLTNMPNETKREEVILRAMIHLKLGLLHADTEELKAGEEQFMKCIELLKNRELEPEAVVPVVSALNQLGIIWSQWKQPAKAKCFLHQAEQIYNDFIKTDQKCSDPVNMVPDFGMEGNNIDEVLEKLHTLTLYYLSQVYISPEDHHKTAIYCHMTLLRQLGHSEIPQDLDYIDWALNSATLSQYFMKTGSFTQARHHLAAASYILQKYEDILKQKIGSNGESELLAAEWENFKHRSADVARCWAKYGILLLNLSKLRLLRKSETEQEDDQLDDKDPLKVKLIEDLKFDVLEKEIIPIASQITDKYLLDFDDARLVFLNAQKWLNQAKSYYTLEDHASDHILIVQDISQAYKYLAFFEEDEDRQAKMHKRRIDILENVIKELNPQYYKSACRQIWFELGEIYSDILEIKFDRLHSSNERPTPQALAKIDRLIKSSMKNFHLFLDSLKTFDIEKEPFPADVQQPALYSYFHLGKLYNKIKTSDKMMQLENIEKSFNAFKFVIDYCKKYPEAIEFIQVGLNTCEDLVNLLSIKIKKLRQEIISERTSIPC